MNKSMCAMWSGGCANRWYQKGNVMMYLSSDPWGRRNGYIILYITPTSKQADVCNVTQQ